MDWNTQAEKGRELGVKARQAKADEFASKVVPKIKELADKGMSLNGIARELNTQDILTRRGNAGAWTPTAVKNALERC